MLHHRFLAAACLTFFMSVVAGCQAGGGLNSLRVQTSPNGSQKERALFDDLVPERAPDYRDYPTPEREYAASMPTVWQVTIEVVKSLGYPVVTADERTGIINTAELTRSFFGKKWRDKYTITLSSLGENQTRVLIKRILEEEDTLERRRYASGFSGSEVVGKEWARKQSNGQYESYILTDIENRLASPRAIPSQNSRAPVNPASQRFGSIPNRASLERGNLQPQKIRGMGRAIGAGR